MPSLTAPTPAPEESNGALSNLSVMDDFQEESAKRKLSIMGSSDTQHSGDYRKDTAPSQTSDLGESPCSRANDPSERAKSSGTAQDESALSGPSAPPIVRSSSECSRSRTILSSDIPVRYPSIEVVVPSPSWKQEATRRSTRAAAAVCKKRLRSGRGTGNHRDRNTTSHNTEQPCQKRKKQRSSIKRLSGIQDSSIPVLCHGSGAIQGIRGSALLTVESNAGPKPAYFFTFVPDLSPMLPQSHTTLITGNQRPYTSDENALLVQLKEREALSWSEITAYFPGRDMSSLQVHYSTKLRHKVSSRSRKLGRRE